MREGARHAPQGLLNNPPWRKVLLRYMPATMSLSDLYRLLGWPKSVQYNRRKFPDLRVSQLAQMATAINAPVGEFLEAVAMEMGIPRLNERVVLKPNAQKVMRARNRHCRDCGAIGHDRRNCPVGSSTSFGLQLLHEEAKASPVRLSRKRTDHPHLRDFDPNGVAISPQRAAARAARKAKRDEKARLAALAVTLVGK